MVYSLSKTISSSNRELAGVFLVRQPDMLMGRVPYLQRLAHSFGSPNYLTESSACNRAMAEAQKLVFGQTARPDVKNARCLLIWSTNPFHSNPGIARNLLRLRERSLKIITVDPRVTPTAAHSDLHLQLRPGTDGALALAMANGIISEKPKKAVHGDK